MPSKMIAMHANSRWDAGSRPLLRLESPSASLCRPAAFLIAGTFLLAQSFSSPALLRAQTSQSPASAPAHSSPQAHKKASFHAKSSTAHPAAPAPVAPPLPDWPANDRPSDAIVTWDARGLSIVAGNSSLSQILKQVCAQTGATMEGLNRDQRIFGVYGPGPARDVIAQLLDGSGYNVLMIGDLGEGTPRQIVLTGRAGDAAKPGEVNQPDADNDNDADPEEQAQQPEPPPPPQQPQPMQNGAAPGVPIRNREQMVEDLQQRLQQQQQQQQANPQ